MSNEQNTHHTPPSTHTNTHREKNHIRKDENKWYPQTFTEKPVILPTPSVLWEKFDLPFFGKLRNLTPSFCKGRRWGGGGFQLCYKVSQVHKLFLVRNFSAKFLQLFSTVLYRKCYRNMRNTIKIE